MGKLAQAWGAMIGKTTAPLHEAVDIDQSMSGRRLTPELFREELADLGYDFEVFTSFDGEIWRFRRIAPPEQGIPTGSDASKGAVW